MPPDMPPAVGAVKHHISALGLSEFTPLAVSSGRGNPQVRAGPSDTRSPDAGRRWARRLDAAIWGVPTPGGNLGLVSPDSAC